MKSKLLLANKFKKIGWILLIPSFILGIISLYSNAEIKWLDAKVFSILPELSIGEPNKYFQIIEANLTNTILGIFCIIGALLVSFSKEKIEDEYIAEIRLNALMWSVLINYVILILAFLLIYDFGFFTVTIFNMYTVPIIFIIKFHYSLYQSSKQMNSEK
jgi:hypothetical protein